MAILVAVLPAAASAADEAILYRFCSKSNCADGQNPFGPLIADATGNLYGTTSAGGDFGLGVVFKLDPAGTETVLHSFAGGSDGATPYDGLAFDASGNLIGTTAYGGGSKLCKKLGCGTVFRIAPDGTETILHAFCLKKKKPCKDGMYPFAGVTLDAAGNIYGTTQYGGSINEGYSAGTVFEITARGKEKIVWSFGSLGDGAVPMSGVTLDDDLGILGTTNMGGVGGGSIYRIQPDGSESLLYTFSTDSPGGSGLTPDGDGHFYGTSLNSLIPGTVYKLTPPKLFVTLHTFSGNEGDGFEGQSGVAYYKGNLYGVTIVGEHGLANGTIFELSTSGKETILYLFQGSADGVYPDATPLVAGGNLYGTTARGGSTDCGGQGCGTVYRYGPIN